MDLLWGYCNIKNIKNREVLGQTLSKSFLKVNHYIVYILVIVKIHWLKSEVLIVKIYFFSDAMVSEVDLNW